MKMQQTQRKCLESLSIHRYHNISISRKPTSVTKTLNVTESTKSLFVAATLDMDTDWITPLNVTKETMSDEATNSNTNDEDITSEEQVDEKTQLWRDLMEKLNKVGLMPLQGFEEFDMKAVDVRGANLKDGISERVFFVKPQYFDLIMTGHKQWETRKIRAQKYSTAYVGMTFTFKEKDGRYAPANKAKGAIHKKCTSMKVLLDRNDFKQDFKELEEDWNGFVLQFEFKDLEEEV
eukprot:830989_1